MQNNNSNTNEGIKAGPPDSVGLQREEGNKQPANKAGPKDSASGTHKESFTGEKDADNMVHEQQTVLPTDSNEHDLDELVHAQRHINDKEKEDELTEEEDMDELVHRNSGKH